MGSLWLGRLRRRYLWLRDRHRRFLDSLALAFGVFMLWTSSPQKRGTQDVWIVFIGLFIIFVGIKIVIGSAENGRAKLGLASGSGLGGAGVGVGGDEAR